MMGGPPHRGSSAPAGHGHRPDSRNARPYLGVMNPTSPDYHQLLTAVKQRVREAQYHALQQVNRQQIQLYWDLASSLPNASSSTAGAKAWSKTWPATCKPSLRA